jgi:hypothetical protein
MNYPLVIETERKGPLKIFGTPRLSDPNSPGKTGWYYPIYLTIEEAINADINNGGKGIFNTYNFYEYRGEFYSAENFKFEGLPNEPAQYNNYSGQGAVNPFSNIKYRLSQLVPDQLPGFVRDEYDNFVVFLKSYYEFLEQNNKAQEVLENLPTYSDIDDTIEDLVENFFKTYAHDITRSDVSNDRFFFKKIRELYSKKGTETSYRILFSYLFKETIEFFYPYTVVLRASDGKWARRLSLKIKKINEQQNMYDFKNTVVVGDSSGARASVNNVLFFSIGEYEFFELELDDKSLIGEFFAGENISTVKNLALSDAGSIIDLQAELYSVISRINITDPGIGYEVGNEVSITDNAGNYARARISGTDLYGGIQSIQIIDSGFDYTSATTIDPGLPTKKIFGTYALKDGKVTVSFPNRHGIRRGANINVNYTGNIFSPVNDTDHNAVVVSVPDIRTIRFRYPGF